MHAPHDVCLLLRVVQVTAYLAGHDHCAQSIDEGLGVQYHGIGASHSCDQNTSHLPAIPQVCARWCDRRKYVRNTRRKHRA